MTHIFNFLFQNSGITILQKKIKCKDFSHHQKGPCHAINRIDIRRTLPYDGPKIDVNKNQQFLIV